MNPFILGPSRILLLVAFGAAAIPGRGSPPPTFNVAWDKVVRVDQSTPTLQVVVNPPLRRGSSIHDATFRALRDLGADYVRYVPWLPYPRLGVAELEPPSPGGTSWDFSLIDPMMADFLGATTGHPTIVNFSTIPEWLFVTSQPVPCPKDPNQVVWDYSQGTELRDPTGKQVADYYARLVSWYVEGGFVDENGQRHSSGHHYKLPVWEVLNEVTFEHNLTPQLYTRIYDQVVAAIRRVSPTTRFMAMALGTPAGTSDWFEYFLDPAHHRPGTPIDYISYHFYATPAAEQGLDNWQYTFFDQADGFINQVGYVEAIRRRLSPGTKTDTDELGAILAGDPGTSVDHPDEVIPDRYWNVAGAMYAYLFIELARLGIDVIGESQLVGYPTQFPSVTMIDWRNGRPTARFWVLQLIKENFHPGDRLVETKYAKAEDDIPGHLALAAQAFQTGSGRKLLVLNRRNRKVELVLPQGLGRYALTTVDEATGEGPPRVSSGAGDRIVLAPFAVTVVSWGPGGAGSAASP